jgi:hypothetical protein
MNFTASPWCPTGYYGDTLPHPSTLHSLIDMRSGTSIPVPSLSDPTPVSPHYYVYPDASGYTPGLSDLYSISASPKAGTLTVGQTIIFTLDMDEPWKVTGKPRLLLSSGGTADYAGGSGTTRLTFVYSVGSGQSADSIAITAVELDGGTIRDAFGNSANMSGAKRGFPGLNVH